MFAYRMILSLILVVSTLWGGSTARGQQAGTPERLLRVVVTETGGGEPLSYAVCSLTPAEGAACVATADEAGVCLFRNVRPGTYRVQVFYMGQTFRQPDIEVGNEAQRTVATRVSYNPVRIGEVVVTASESKTLSATSRIGLDAIRHIQPSSIADLLELLPGGRSSDPDFSAPQSIRLREASPAGSNYETSSLGTQFLIDGVPVSNDANLQATPAYSNYGTSFVNSGVDMRSISTDDIESVEIVRGIPSVEYGDLTSGMVKVNRKRGGNDLHARFKADMSSKLFYAGKGFEWGETDKLTANISLNWLDAKSDPRNTRQNYTRLTGSLRVDKEWKSASRFNYALGGNVDYTGSFDDEKSDRNLDNGDIPLERYKSSYNRVAMGTRFRMAAREERFFRSLDITLSATMENDVIDRWKYVAMVGEVPLSTNLDEGEWDVTVVPTEYEAALRVEGRPFYGYGKAVASFRLERGESVYGFKAGTDWSMSKNYGDGTVFDPARPFSVDMNMRPRVFSGIPALHQGAFFLENNSTLPLGAFRLKWMAGLRAQTMMGLGGRYALQGKVYLDPRLNLRLDLPRFEVLGDEMRLALAGGTGWHTKMPTIDQLFPDPVYYDVTQLNYWSTDVSKRRINVRVFKFDVTNYDLRAARNFKWEIRGDADWKGYSLSVTYFREDMKSGFRSSGEPVTMVYKDYDEEAIDGTALAGPPSLDATPYVTDTLLTTLSRTTNGSRTQKQGIEFTLVTPRIRPLLTKFTVTGAWFRTLYDNSRSEYYQPAVTIGGKTYPYIGYYEDEDGYVREMFNTNFTADTQVPRLGLIFSSSFQCLWFTGSRTEWKNPYPIAYVDKHNVRHPFTEESARNPLLAELVREYNSTVYDYNRVPFSMNINLKVTKTLYRDKIALAVFANKLLDYTPSYRTRYGSLVRRDVTPYFGMELNFKL